MKRLPTFSLSLLLSQTLLLAQTTDELHQILEEATTIATKTNLNADYVPGTVTVISGDKLKSLGINNLAEPNAYDAIVGFDSSTISLRGTGPMYGAQGNKIKWMINNKAISSEIWNIPKLGVGQLVIPIPTDAIDRIEIIRGPGSAIYGGNAIYGVVNIITKKESASLFTTLSQQESNKFGKELGGYGSFEENDLKVTAIASVGKNDGWNLPITTRANPESGNLPSAYGNNLVMTDFSYANVNLWAYRLEAQNDYTRLQWDPTNYLPRDNSDPVQSNTYTMLGVEGKFDIAPNSLFTAKAGFNRYTNVSEVIYYPAYKLINNNPNGLDGVRKIDYAESTKYVEGTLETTAGSHRLLGGIYASFLTVDHDDVRQYYNNSTTYNPQGNLSHLLTATKPKRINRALYAQDEIQLDEKNMATIGVRYDTYSDDRHAISPRIALVHQYDDSNIFKAQYSRAFRPPSFAEQYSPNNQPSHTRYESEIADTYELSHIYKTRDTSIKTVAFYSTTSNMITYHDWTYETINLAEKTALQGLEIELEKNFGSMNLGGNMGYYDSRRGEVKLVRGSATYTYEPSEFALAAKVSANAFATINSDTTYPTTFWYHYTGSKHRVSNAMLYQNGATTTIFPTNGSIPAQDYLNITQKINGIVTDLDLAFGVSNVFGKTLNTLEHPLNPPDTSDMPYMGRTFWANLLYKF